eukprot:2602009-Prymnesium_polylepis.2
MHTSPRRVCTTVPSRVLPCTSGCPPRAGFPDDKWVLGRVRRPKSAGGYWVWGSTGTVRDLRDCSDPPAKHGRGGGDGAAGAVGADGGDVGAAHGEEVLADGADLMVELFGGTECES